MATRTVKERDLKLQSWFQASDETMQWYILSKGKMSEYSNQLIALASILIALVGGVIFSHPKPNNLETIFIIFSLGFLIVSDICGFLQMVITSQYYDEFVKLNAKRSKLYANNLNESLDLLRTIDENYDKPEKLNKVNLYFQSGTFGLGLISIIAVIISYIW